MYIKPALTGQYTKDYIERTYEYFIFGKIGNRPIAICHNRDFTVPYRVYVEENARRELWKVHMDMQMGKGYQPNQIDYRPCVFEPTDNFNRYEIFKITRQ